MGSPSRPPRHPGRYGLPEASSLPGLELSLPYSRKPSVSRSNSSIASSINKPLPPSPRLKTPPVPNLRASCSFSVRAQEEIIQSYVDREPVSSLPDSGWSSPVRSLRDEVLPSRAFVEPSGTKSLLSLTVPHTRLPSDPYKANDSYTSSDTKLPLRGAGSSNLPPQSRLRQTHPYSAPSPLEGPHDRLRNVSTANSDASIATQYSSTASVTESRPPSPHSFSHPIPQFAVYDMADNIGGPYSVSPLTSPPKSPDWRSSARSDLSPVSTKSKERDKSSYLASLYRRTLPPGPHTIPDLPSHPRPDSSSSVQESPILPPPPLRLSQMPNGSRDDTQSTEDRPTSHFSDSLDTPTSNAPGFTTLRSLAKKALHRHKTSVEEDRQRQRVLETAELKYPAMASPATSKRQTHAGRHRSSIQTKFDDMYDTLTTLSPLKSRTASAQTTFPSTYAWTPVVPINPSPFAREPNPIEVVQEEAEKRQSQPVEMPSWPPPRPSRGSRPKQLAVPVTPYQLLGPKAWELEEQAKKKAAKEAKKQKSGGFRPNSSRLSGHRDRKRGRERAYTSGYLGTERSAEGLMPWERGLQSTARMQSPKTPKYGKMPPPKTPKTPRLPRLWSSRLSEPGEGSWLGRRRAKKEEERTERWKADVKKRIVVVSPKKDVVRDNGTPRGQGPRGSEQLDGRNSQDGWV